jgi:superfamily II DNA helicase RecQ
VLNETGFVKPIKNCQKECLVHVLSEKDEMAIMLTEYGISLILQLAPFAFLFYHFGVQAVM